MLRSLNIAMVAACPFPTSQGSQVLIRELSEALVRRGHRLHIVTYHFGEDRPCPGLIIHRIPELFRYKKFRSGPEIRKPLLDLLLSRKLDEVVRLQQIDIIHCHNYEAPVVAFPVRFLRKVPVVYHSHNTMSDEFYTYFRLKLPQILARGAAHLMDRLIPRQADFVIAINRAVVDFLANLGTPVGKIKFIPPGIDFGDEIVEIDEALIRSRLELGKCPIIVYAGNLDGYQRMDLLVEALPAVFKSYPQARLVLLTSSDPEPFLRIAAAKEITASIVVVRNPSFQLTREILSISQIAVNPRISWSGYPIKLLNYMAAGLPVVAFQGAAPCVVDESSGLLAPAGDTDAFSRLLLRLMDHPDEARTFGLTGKEVIQRNHSWDAIAVEIENIYAKLLNIAIPADKRHSLVASNRKALSVQD
ncbi:MAG: glycosyltransferase family 4 protein [bacterium]|nr:glycosyltransferase family 4 protein [bacterium]